MALVTRRRAGLRLVTAGVVALLWSVTVAGPAVAADPVTFGTPTASSTFGQGVDFNQPVTLPGDQQRVEILISTPGSVGPEVQPVPDKAPSGSTTLHYRLDTSDGHIVPNTTFTARWRIVTADGTPVLGPAVKRVYADDRFDWKTIDGDVVRVHWIEGNQAFGERALKIGDSAVKSSAALLGVTETEPIDFFIYADQASFYDALGPATRENVGGQAHPDIRTLFALITPSDIDASWVESVVPHELTHVVFQTAVDNPYHDPPHWLNEGLAVYESDGYQGSDRRQVEAAARDGSLIPLDGLAGAFPTSRDRFFLAYAESVAAVDHIVRTEGRDALVSLIRSYHDGVSDDEAFRTALGQDVTGFEAGWLEELHATRPQRLGPRAAPAGPLPEGWTGPQPNPSFEVLGTEPPQPPGAPRPHGIDDDLVARVLAPTAGLLGLVLLVLIGFLASRRIARRGEVGPDAGWNRVYGRPTIREPAGSADAEAEADPGPVPEPPPTAPVLPGIHFGAATDDDDEDEPEPPR
jgi:hypothetical protein